MATINPFSKSDDRAAVIWRSRLDAANLYFLDWERRFKCKTLDDYFEGKQWKENDRYEPYVINLVYSTIKVKNPSLLFTQPNFHVTPRPNKADFDPNSAFGMCQMLEDTVNTVLSNGAVLFGDEVELALLDSWSYFGIVEVGYSANWIVNPNANMPILKSDYDPDYMDKDGKVITQPERIPEEEFIYVKRIPAHRFRVGGFNSSFLTRCNWCGYYEWIRTQDLLSAGVSEEQLGGFGNYRSNEFVYDKDEAQISQQGDLQKVWKIWDLRAKEFLLIKDSPATILFKPEKFNRLPLIDLRFTKRRKGFYPMPPVFNWKPPQDEQNEAHEMLRAHRRKARSLFQSKVGSVDPDEEEKMMAAPDMTIIHTNQDQAIKPIDNPAVDSSLSASLAVSKEDFNVVSLTSSEQRLENNRTTATQAQIINQRSTIGETAEQAVVAQWLCKIAKEALLQIREKFALPFWIKVNQDMSKPPDEIPELEANYKMITAEDLGEIDFNVNISVESMSPVVNDQEKRKFYEFLAAVTQYPLVGTNPDVVFELAYRIGYRNNKIIKAVAKIAQLNAMMMASKMGGAVPQNTAAAMANSGQPGGGGGNQAAQTAMANATPPDLSQIVEQLRAAGGNAGSVQ